MEDENLYDKIKELFGNIPDNFNILEEVIDIDLQLEYFEFSRKHRKDFSKEDVIRNKEDLFKDKVSDDRKKTLLVQLASIEDVEAYRTIEKFLKDKENPLYYWAVLACQESRMLLESKILEENQVFISTGLGGKENKLRYFVVLISKSENPFSTFQEDIINKEFNYVLKKNEAEVEEIHLYGSFITLVTLIPLELSLKNIFKEAIKECNQYGDFLSNHFIVTNVKKLSKEEIIEFLKDRSGKQKYQAKKKKSEHRKTDELDENMDE
ncbi:MAG: hypothetical protein JXB49_26790 [Bacteroidales bacterium]|nr:hypothetical protein [Bacteroidales bacterium]